MHSCVPPQGYLVCHVYVTAYNHFRPHSLNLCASVSFVWALNLHTSDFASPVLKISLLSSIVLWVTLVHFWFKALHFECLSQCICYITSSVLMFSWFRSKLQYIFFDLAIAFCITVDNWILFVITTYFNYWKCNSIQCILPIIN